jgi:hypothetical protein
VTQPATLLVIRRDVFEKKLNAADPFVKGLLRILVRNVRSLADDVGPAPAAETAADPASPPPTPA